MPQSYASQFVLATGPEGLPLVRDDVLDWVRSAHQGDEISIRPQAGDYDLGRFGKAVITAEEFEHAKVWSLVWDRPDADGREIVWRSEVQLATLGADVEVTVSVRIISANQAVVPERADVDRPRLVSFLASKHRASVGGRMIDVEPTRILGSSVSDFHESTLRSADRVLPVVVVSPFNRSALYAIDPKNLADRLAAIAEVAVINSPAVAWEFAQTVGRPFACFDGAVRVFWPGFDPAGDDAYRHRLWLARHIDQPRRFSDRLFGELSSYAARLVREGAIWTAASDSIKRGPVSELRRRLEIAERQLEAHVESKSEFEELAAQVADEEKRMREVAEEERDQLRTENASLRAQVEQLSIALRHSDEEPDREPASEDAETDSDFSDVLSAVKRATDNFQGLRFLPSAFESAGRSPYQRPEDVYSAFSTLNELSEARVHGPLGMALEDWLLERNIRYSPHQSQTTRERYADQYTFPEGEHKWDMQEHLIFGSSFDPRHCLRIHFAWDEQAKQHVIGWVGRHRRNTKT